MISYNSLCGYILEEAIARLVSGAGYRLITRREDDPHDLDYFGNGLQVRGRGGFHQADVLGELAWAPAFGNPIRLFIEAKWRSRNQFNTPIKVGITEVRHAVGITQDINQLISTVKIRDANAPPLQAGRYAYGFTGRGFCYTYRYALFSITGFSKPAQAYALAHQVSLIDLSGPEFESLLRSISNVSKRLIDQRRIDKSDSREYDDGTDQSEQSRPRFLQNLRTSMRASLWQDYRFESEIGLPARYESLLSPVLNEIHEIGDLFFGVSATGFLLLLKADRPDVMLAHMRAPRDPHVNLLWDPHDPLAWTIEIQAQTDGYPQISKCILQFRLPENLLRALYARGEEGRRAAALDIKQGHFSRITLYHITSEKTLTCSLKIDKNRLAEVRRELGR